MKSGGAAGYENGYSFGTFQVYNGVDGNNGEGGSRIDPVATGGKGGTTSAGSGGGGSTWPFLLVLV